MTRSHRTLRKLGGLLMIVCLLIGPGAVRAELIIPAEKRIVSKIVTTLAAPADKPMHMPTDVAVDRRGMVFVADGTNDRIVRFTRGGKFAGVIRSSDGESLNRPVGLTVGPADRLWIADTGNHRVIVIGPDGKLIETIRLAKPMDGRAPDPTDVAVTADGRRTYIVDNDNHRLLIRDNEGRTLSTMGRFGRGLGQFQWPFMVCISPKGYVYISDVIGARAQRLSRKDRWAGQVPARVPWGVRLGQLYRPKGVAVDRRGRLYISDSTLSVVQVFDAEGGLAGVLTDPAGKPLRFRHPMGMCFGAGGRLYVVELGADRVAVIEVKDLAIPPETATADRAGRNKSK